MDKQRIKTSLHDFIFVYGILGIVISGLFATGFIGGAFSWAGVTSTGLANYEYAGTYKDGKIKGGGR